ncbi:MAG TPA: universal stress protein [Planctomycetaceae bacterium]|nr:universal stress protein [Planctomycetaceae bacterium]
MRSILLHVDNDDCLEARFQAALDLARAFEGHLTCAQPIPYGVAASGDFYGTMAAELLTVLEDNADKFRTRVEARLGNEDIPWTWVQKLDAPEHLLLTHAALSDLIVLGARDPNGGNGASSLAGSIAIHALTPVLVVPEGPGGFDVSVPAVVAWNGSIEASHALRAAVPLLKRAASVVLLTIEEPRTRGYDLPAVEGAEYLSRHGIECEMVERAPLDDSIEEGLLHAIETHRAGYLVMGAYGHSRLSEVVLGGSTRSLLEGPPVPLFLCH